MNYRRIILAGIAAAAIIFASELLQTRLAGRVDGYLPSLAFAGSWATFVLASVAYGSFLAWLSAAMRPRYGRARALFIAGGALWIVGYLLPDLGILTLSIPRREVLSPPEAELARDILVVLAWGAVEILLAAAAAGWLYREADAPGVQAAR